MRRRRREHGGVCVNGAKPGASACFWEKGGAGVLGGRSVSQSINQSGRWAIGGRGGGGGRKVESGCSRYC